MNKEYSVSKKQVSVYKVRPKQKNRFTWADVTIEEWTGGGSFMANSDFGVFAYVWNAIGDRTFREFLCGLDYYYFMGKAHPSHGERFSVDETIKDIKRDILERRRERNIDDAETARELWDEIEDLEAEYPNSETLFFAKLESTDIPEKVYDYDYTSIPTGGEKHPQCAAFWNEIWPALTAFWRDELKKEGKAA